MELIKQHIETYLPDFADNHQSVFFDELFIKLCSLNKLKNKALLEYIFGIIETNSQLPINPNFLNSLHLHIELENNLDTKTLILEFLWHYHFNKAYALDKKEYVNDELENKIEKLTNIVNRPLELPYNVTKPQEKKIRKERLLIREYLKCYKTLNSNSSLVPKSLLNVKVNQEKILANLLEKNPFYLRIQELSEVNSYAVVNLDSFNSISKLKLDNIPVFKLFENIILFDCEDRVQRFNQFNLQNLQNLNQRHGTSFKNFIIITFGNNVNSISSIRHKFDLINDRFKIPNVSTYSILNSEIDFLLKRKESSLLSIEFVGYELSSSWDTFVLETSIRELYELRSIKLMNIYSICYTDEIKNYIIGDIFSNKESSELISSTTKLAILELRDEDIEVLKEALSNTLDVIMNSGIKSKVSDLLSNNPTIILDEAILRNQNLLSKIKICLGLTNTTKFKTWSDLINSDLKELLILSYRDQGRYPNYYFPSLVELDLDSECIARAILPGFFFIHYYNWSKYNLYKEYHKLLNHPIREQYFEWNKLKNRIKELKPEHKFHIDWNLENEYSNSDQREIFKIKLNNQRSKTYHSSDFIIFSEVNSDKPRIERVKWFYENIDVEDTKYKIQKLEELLDEFNPAERLIDTAQQEKELEIIRKELGLENETAARIWKILLRKKADNIGFDSLYEELKTLFIKNNIPLVRKSYFVDSWLNFETTSLMPRGNKVVKVLFDYLNLNISYRLILYRLKNASISGKIEATKKYSRLLKDLFYDRCFDEKAPLKSIIESRIQYYQNNYSLEELGIDNESPFIGLTTLIQLIQPELRLTELETIQRITNE